MHFRQWKRRNFITLLSSAAAYPLVARAQGGRMRRVGVLINLAADDPQSQLRVVAFAQRLSELGWTKGGNVRIDYRWGKTRKSAAKRPTF